MRPVLLLAALALAGCLDAGGPPPAQARGEPVPFRTLLATSASPTTEGRVEGALDPAAWRAAWARYAEAGGGRESRPFVDHERQRVLAFATGSFGSTCHYARIEDVTRSGDALVVRAVEWSGEGPGRACGGSVSYPAHFVAVDDTVAPVRFDVRRLGPDEPYAYATSELTPTEPLAPRVLAEGTFSGIHEDRRMVLRDASAWEALWREHKPNETAPGVEWANETVIAVVVHGPTGCAGMHLGDVGYDEAARVTRVDVVVEAADPALNCLVPSEDLFVFAALPTREGDVRFEEAPEPPRAPTPAPTPPGVPAPAPPSPMPGDLAFRSLDRGAQSGIQDARRIVVEDERAWAALWAEHATPFVPAPERPAVDFARERVVLVSAGEKPCTGHGIEVVRVEERAEDVRVEVLERGPEGRACGFAITTPYHFVAVPRSEKPVVFGDGRGGVEG